MISTFSWHRTLLLSWVAIALVACSSAPQVTRTQEISENADAPYHKILVITLFEAFDPRFKGRFVPAAYSCMIPTICSSVNRDSRIVCSPCSIEHYLNRLSFQMDRFSGGRSLPEWHRHARPEPHAARHPGSSAGRTEQVLVTGVARFAHRSTRWKFFTDDSILAP